MSLLVHPLILVVVIVLVVEVGVGIVLLGVVSTLELAIGAEVDFVVDNLAEELKSIAEELKSIAEEPESIAEDFGMKHSLVVL